MKFNICFLSFVLIAGLKCVLSQSEIIIDRDNIIQTAYQGNSFVYVKQVILKPGFSVSAATHGNWYARSFAPNNAPIDLNKNFVRTEVILKGGITTDDQVSKLSYDNKS